MNVTLGLGIPIGKRSHRIAFRPQATDADPTRKQANSRLDEPEFTMNASRRPDRAPGQAAAARKKTDLPREKGPPLRNFGRTHITFGQSDCKSGNFLYLCPVRNPEMFSAISFILEYIATALKSV